MCCPRMWRGRAEFLESVVEDRRNDMDKHVEAASRHKVCVCVCVCACVCVRVRAYAYTQQYIVCVCVRARVYTHLMPRGWHNICGL